MIRKAGRTLVFLVMFNLYIGKKTMATKKKAKAKKPAKKAAKKKTAAKKKKK